MSISQTQYLIAENDSTLSGNIMMDKLASENVTVEVTISDGSAKGNVNCATCSKFITILIF